MPDGIAIGIYDFGIIHNAGHTIRVGNILGGVQVVHCAVQHGIAVSSVACHIPLCIQINLRDTDFAQCAVILHDAVRSRGGVAVLIGSLAAGIGGIASGGILGGVIDFILSSACNLVAGLTVRLFDVDLQRPLSIAHLVGVVGVGRYCNGLVAAVAAPVGFKTVGDGDFVITEL